MGLQALPLPTSSSLVGTATRFAEDESVITPEQIAFLAGVVWLDSGVDREPTENDLAEIASRLSPKAYSLAVVKACVPVASACGFVLEARRLHAKRPELLAWMDDVPTW